MVNPLPSLALTANSTTICAGTTATITAIGAATYVWNNNLGTAAVKTITPSSTTSYTVTGTTIAGCFTTAKTTITVIPLPTITLTDNQTALCVGSTVTITANGAATYIWNQNLGTGAVKRVSPTTTTSYSVTGTSLTGCKNTATTTLTVNPLPIVTISTNSTFVCEGTSAILTANGAMNYIWNKNLGTGAVKTVNPIATTTNYIVTGTSINGCRNTATITITLNRNPKPIITLTATPTAICAGSTAAITAKGAANYIWNNNLGNGTDKTVSPTATTSYTVTGISAAGCSNTATTTITVNPLPTVTITVNPNPICAGSNTTMLATGAASYLWGGNLGVGAVKVVNPTITAKYRVIGTSLAGCMSSIVGTTVVVNPLPTITTVSNSNVICTGASAVITANGALNYVWSDNLGYGNSKSVSPRFTTRYTVTGTALNGCSNIGAVTVVVSARPAPTITLIASSNTLCFGATATISAMGALNYVWSNNLGTGYYKTLSPSSTTTYSVTGTAFNGCKNIATTTISVNTSPEISVTSIGNAICAGTPTTIRAWGGTSYIWSNNAGTGASITVSPTTTTMYSVTGTTNGCSSMARTTISVSPEPTITVTANPTAICAGSSSTITATGAVSYIWNTNLGTDNSITITPSSTTSYTVTGTGINGCHSIASTTVTVNPIPTITLTANPNPICVGSLSTITAAGGSTYVWNNNLGYGNSKTVSPLVSTSYSVTGTSIAGCSSIGTTDLRVNQIPIVTLTANPNTICAGATATLTASGYLGFAWNQNLGNGTVKMVKPTTTTNYSVTATTIAGCKSIATTTVTVNPLPSIVLTPNENAVCIGTATNITATGASTYIWNNNLGIGTAKTVSPSALTSYSVTGTTVAGCSNTASTTVSINPLPTITITENPTAICVGSTATITATGAQSFTWNNALGTGASKTISPNLTTTYSVTGIDESGCSNTLSQIVTVNPLPTVTVNSGSLNNNTFTLVATASGKALLTYNWPNNGSTTATDVVTQTGIYTTTVIDGNGCQATAQGTVTPTPIKLPAISSVCYPQSGVSLDAGQFASYSWSGPGIAGKTTWNPLWVTTSGVYTVTATTASGQTYIATTTVTIHPQYTPTLTSNTSSIVNNTITNCPGTDFILKTDPGYSEYVWNGLVKYYDNIYSTSSAGNISFYVIDKYGCYSNTIYTNLQYYTVPQAIISQSNVLTGTNNATLSVYDGTFTSFHWSTGATSRSITIANAGTYTVTAITANGCESVTTIADVLNAVPLSIIKQPATIGINLIAQSVYNDYSWYNVNAPNQQIGGGNTINVITAGTYRVDEYNNGIKVATTTVTVVFDASTGHLKEDVISSDYDNNTPLNINPSLNTPLVVIVFPQPANNVLNIQSTSPVNSVEMIDMNGKVVISLTNTTVIDITTLPSATYQMLIETVAGISSKTVVIAR
jgi:hypothetical protein